MNLATTLKYPLRLLPNDAVWPILSGPLRGTRWIVGSSRKAFWIGTYERHFQKLLAQVLTPSSVFYDIGAHVGFYSLLAAKKGCCTISFEPVPRNFAFLRRHAELNSMTIKSHALAISDKCGETSFDEGPDVGAGHLGNGSLTVRTATIDSLIERGFPLPTHIKMDIEGAELMALHGAADTLRQHKPTLFLATHGYEIHDGCRTFLENLGFTFTLLWSEADRADVIVHY